jgi:hypothetical protein
LRLGNGEFLVGEVDHDHVHGAVQVACIFVVEVDEF